MVVQEQILQQEDPVELLQAEKPILLEVAVLPYQEMMEVLVALPLMEVSEVLVEMGLLCRGVMVPLPEVGVVEQEKTQQHLEPVPEAR